MTVGTRQSAIGPVALRTSRLLLRRFRLTDVDDALAYRNDPEFALYLPHIPQPFTRKHAEMFVETNIAEWERSPTFAVEHGGSVIGTVTLDIELANEIAMLGYAIGRRWWRRGIATEATRTVVDWSFSAFGLAKVWAATDARNRRSIRLLERLGLQAEGCLRDHERSRDGRTDRLMFGVLRAEWLKRRNLPEIEVTAPASSPPSPLAGEGSGMGGVQRTPSEVAP
jgi:[ribosomal protein S5]-alanine N-acetyltransferase